MAQDVPVSKDDVLAAARRLSATDLVELFLALRDELLGGPIEESEDLTADAEFSPEQLAELDHRLARHRADPNSSVPWEQIESELVAKFGQDP